MAAAPANENFEEVTATEGGNNTTSLTVNTLSYVTNGSGTVETYAVSPYWGITSANHTGKAIIANYNGTLNSSITNFRFGSVTTTNKFRLNSLSAFANEIVSSYSYAVIFNVQGYSGGIAGTLVVSANLIDMRTSNTYGTGNAAVVYARDASVASNAGNVGTLTFGSAWDNIDTVVFTAADSKPFQLSLDTLVFSAPSGVPPTVASISSTTANGSYNATTLIPITVNFNAPVTVTGTPTLALNTSVTASYASGSGTSTLTFNYTVGAGQNATLLDCASTNALTLVGGTINATTGGTAANLTLPTPGGANSLGLNKALVIDTTAPTISSIARQTPSGQTTASNIVTFRVTYSEPVTVPGASNFSVVAVNGSNIVGTVTSVTGSGTTRDVTVSITSGTGEFRLRAVN
jgi:hypothetical protein